MIVSDQSRKEIGSHRGFAVILAGSESDKDHIDNIVKALDLYNIPRAIHIRSAHKQPQELYELVQAYNIIDGSLTFIAVAGGTDALSGIVAWHSRYPVISCPPDGLNHSCLSNPSGSSNAVILIPSNVARFIAQMYSGHNSDYVKKLVLENEQKIAWLKDADNKYQ